jgi:hypothetical protein
MNRHKSIIKKERKNICKLYRDGQFYWWKKTEYVEKTTDLTNFITLCCTPRDSNSHNIKARRRPIDKLYLLTQMIAQFVQIR